MVGRFVKQQQIGLFEQQTAQRHATTLATREHGDRTVGRRAAQGFERDLELAVQLPAVASVDLFLQFGLFGQKRSHLVICHRLCESHRDLVETIDSTLEIAEAERHVLTDGQCLFKLRLLLQITDACAFGAPGLAAIFLFNTGHDLEKGRFTGAVDTEHTDLDAGKEGESDALEDFAPPGIGLRQVLHDIDILVGGHDGSPDEMVGRKRRERGSNALHDGAEPLRPAGLEPATKPL